MQNETLITNFMTLLSTGQSYAFTALSEKLSCSTSELLKLIKQLEQYGVNFNIHEQTIALTQAYTPLNNKSIQQHLNSNMPISIYNIVDSTNLVIKQNQHITTNIDSATDTTVCLAEYQSHGRGRRERDWHSPFGQNIYFSLKQTITKPIAQLASLGLVVALSICQAIEKSYALPYPLTIKWPNDILADGKKLAGILLEVEPDNNKQCTVVIGIGINVNMMVESDSITQAWTSITKLNQQNNDRNILCANLINSLLADMSLFEQQGLSAFQQVWDERDALFNKQITLSNHQHNFSGKALGINQEGHLQLKLNSGEVKVFAAGDTSILAR